MDDDVLDEVLGRGGEDRAAGLPPMRRPAASPSTATSDAGAR